MKAWNDSVSLLNLSFAHLFYKNKAYFRQRWKRNFTNIRFNKMKKGEEKNVPKLCHLWNFFSWSLTFILSKESQLRRAPALKKENWIDSLTGSHMTSIFLYRHTISWHLKMPVGVYFFIYLSNVHLNWRSKLFDSFVLKRWNISVCFCENMIGLKRGCSSLSCKKKQKLCEHSNAL